MAFGADGYLRKCSDFKNSDEIQVIPVQHNLAVLVALNMHGGSLTHPGRHGAGQD